MNICKGITLKGKKCKNKCQNKYCNKHSKKQKGGTGILKKPKKVGRFTITKDTTPKSVKINKNVVEKVIKIEKNDCPKNQRPRLTKTNLTMEEMFYDNSVGVNRTKKYKKTCPPGSKGIFKTKKGNDCCIMDNKHLKKTKKSSLNPKAKEFKM